MPIGGVSETGPDRQNGIAPHMPHHPFGGRRLEAGPGTMTLKFVPFWARLARACAVWSYVAGKKKEAPYGCVWPRYRYPPAGPTSAIHRLAVPKMIFNLFIGPLSPGGSRGGGPDCQEFCSFVPIPARFEGTTLLKGHRPCRRPPGPVLGRFDQNVVGPKPGAKCLGICDPVFGLQKKGPEAQPGDQKHA